MKPYFQDDAVTIYHGDCREIAPTLTGIDCVVTDPPYGVRARTGGKGKTRKYLHDYGVHNDSEDFVRDSVVPLLAQFIGKIPVAVTPGAKNLWFFPRPETLGGFYHPAACGMTHWGFLDFDPILFYGRDPRVGKTIKPCTYRLTEVPPRNGHPCPRPVYAWSWLVQKVSLEGQTILDPFGGSGTTGLCAKENYRKAILIELEERYCEIAASRMAQGVLDFSIANNAVSGGAELRTLDGLVGQGGSNAD